MQEVIYQEN
jgi:hypothetical protein